MSTLKAMTSVLHMDNHNLTPLQKIWLRWHIKLGHLSFNHVQKLALGGFLDRLALGLLRTRAEEQPPCAACQYGKQTRKPDGSTTTTKNPSKLGALKEGQLTPGSCIFCDQLKSRVRGRLPHTAGREPDKDKFCGTSVFCDAASGYIHVEHQVTLNAADSIMAKDSFERVAQQYGVSIDSYHTDNGIFKSARYVESLHAHGQSIRYSGVGPKWQNGVAEGAIRIVVSKPAP